MSMMKIPLCSLACLLALVSAGLADPPAPPQESRSLARGYAAAFTAMDKSPVSIVYSSQGQIETIKDVTQIAAFEGVLLIRGYGGGKQILDAGRVIKITDD